MSGGGSLDGTERIHALIDFSRYVQISHLDCVGTFDSRITELPGGGVIWKGILIMHRVLLGALF